ncbi:MAG: HAD family phosphatase [Rhodobacteraceae bacterium]|nr:HAD family phosphatase [Paracoccaceae bacterium]
MERDVKPVIRAVVFDIGHVLIDWQPEAFYDRQIGAARRRALFDAVDLFAMNEKLDLGGDFRLIVCSEADNHPEFHDEIMMWFERWSELTGHGFEHSVRLLFALKARGIPVFALSNFGVGPFEIARVIYPFLEVFERKYISGHLGMIKPDPAIYAHVEGDCGLRAGALLFIDDRKENIAAAGVRGWQTHLFEGGQGLAMRLVREGLLSEEEVI